MTVLICKMCGGDLEIHEGMTTIKCPYCGTNQTLPKFGDEKRFRLYDRANHYRRSNDYDKAMAMYEQILNEDPTDSEAYWSIVLCRYGIEYVEDPETHKRIPTVNRTQYTSVLADEDYKAALSYADAVQAKLYEQEAEAIYTIQKGILQVSQKEEAYDIFICCKETDDAGNRTKDSVLADEIYCQLTKEGYRVFFARITLQDKPGTAYEPYLFAALHSAGIMIVVGTSPENLQAAWVRNEWSRYLTLIRQGERKALIPVYCDMDPYTLPAEFAHLQALDMSKLGCMQDLLHGIRKIFACCQKPEEEADSTGHERFGWKRGAAIAGVLILALLLIKLGGIYRRQKTDHDDSFAPVQQEEAQGKYTERHTEWQQAVMQQEETSEDVVFTGVLEEFVSQVYQRSAKEVTDSQLAKIRQLIIKRERNIWNIGYSFEAPADGLSKGFEEDSETGFGDGLEWVSFCSESELELSGLSRFTELKKLDVCGTLTAEDLKGLHLESVSAYFDSPQQAGSVLKEPGSIKELGFNGSVESLEGMDQFENLETLFIEYLETDNIDALIYAKGLKNLSMYCDEKLTDFTVIGKLTNLEKLSLNAEKMKVLDFIGTLEQLAVLKIDGANIRTLSGLEACGSLQSLTIINCMELKDMSAVSGLAELRELELDMPYGCAQPDLNALVKLNRLSLIGQFEDFSFLRNMSDLAELRLIGCSPDEGADLSKLTSLKKLSCDSLGGSQLKASSLEAFGMLECLDLRGAATYDDISGLFRMPNLKELNISGMECEIDFDKVPENCTLESLHMDHMYLYENVQVYYHAGLTSASMDEVSLDEHTDFFTKFPELKELYLSGNGLTDISFAGGLPALETLDISDNYITQLRPLGKLPSLRKVICTGNPLKDETVLKDSVLVISQDGPE